MKPQNGLHALLVDRTVTVLRGLAGIAAGLLLSVGCTAEPAPPGSPTSGATPPPPSRIGSPSPPPLEDVRIHARRIATLQQPLAMAVRRDDDALYVAEKDGAVRAIRRGIVDPVPVLDLRGQVSLGGEQGLLGLAFAPDGRRLYVNFTDLGGNTHVVEYGMAGDRADEASRRDLLVVQQPYANHNGGNLVFGPDGYLYVGLGDGGSGGDPHGNGQSTSTLLGKMLRIDPRPSGGRPYGIPDDNPFVGRSDVHPEIWALGLRNPWRYSFDRVTGDLWIADVGQQEWEEIDRRDAGSAGGENYGWNILEGSHPFAGDAVPGGGVPPVFEYSHADGGCTVIGGYVYRGRSIPELEGAYLFGDLCLGEIEAIRVAGDHVTDHVGSLGPVVPSLSSFGEDGDGELYAMSLRGGVYRLVPVS